MGVRTRPGPARHPTWCPAAPPPRADPSQGGTFQRTTPTSKIHSPAQGGRTRDEPARRSPRPLSHCDLEMIYSYCTRKQNERESRASPLGRPPRTSTSQSILEDTCRSSHNQHRTATALKTRRRKGSRKNSKHRMFLTVRTRKTQASWYEYSRRPPQGLVTCGVSAEVKLKAPFWASSRATHIRPVSRGWRPRREIHYTITVHAVCTGTFSVRPEGRIARTRQPRHKWRSGFSTSRRRPLQAPPQLQTVSH